MQTFHNGYRGLTLLVDVNRERMLYPLMISIALMAGAWFGTN
jgi:hypothetical protein